MRRIRGFTMMELVAVLVVIGALSAAAAFVTLNARTTTDRMMGERLLAQVAGAQEEHFRQRGAWVTDPGAFSAMAAGATLTNGASTAADVVSVVIRETSTGGSAVGMAVITGEGKCVTLLLPEPDTGQVVRDSFVASASRPCTGVQS
jgi:prepilin-type N-terminal cleavage/methylation domain-containing protein